MKLLAFGVGCAAAATVFLGTAQAQTTTYDYSGQSMSGIAYGDESGYDLEYGQSPVCCATLAGSITLASPLAPNLTNSLVDPLSATFDVSVTGSPLLTNYAVGGTFGGALVQGAEYDSSGNRPLFDEGFEFSTNSSGQITNWMLVANAGLPAGSAAAGGLTVQTSPDDDYFIQTATDQHGNSIDVASNGGGSWSLSSSGGAAPAPEIDAAGALPAITMLLGMVAIIRGRRSVVQPPG